MTRRPGVCRATPGATAPRIRRLRRAYQRARSRWRRRRRLAHARPTATERSGDDTRAGDAHRARPHHRSPRSFSVRTIIHTLRRLAEHGVHRARVQRASSSFERCIFVPVVAVRSRHDDDRARAARARRARGSCEWFRRRNARAQRAVPQGGHRDPKGPRAPFGAQGPPSGPKGPFWGPGPNGLFSDAPSDSDRPTNRK